MAGQVGFSLVLLVAAGLFLRSLQRAASVETGFDARDAYLTQVDLSLEGYEPEEGTVFQRQLVEHLRSLPGVREAALSIDLPLDLGSHGTEAVPEGWNGPEGRERLGIDFNYVVRATSARSASPCSAAGPSRSRTRRGASPSSS